MKKILLFIVFCLVIGVTASAKPNKSAPTTYKVEKAFNVYQGGSEIKVGSTISPATVVEIKGNGYLMFVDNNAKKRYYVSRKCKSTVKSLVVEVKKPKSVSKIYLEQMMTDSKRYEYSSAGNVERVPTPETINVETDANGDIEVYMIDDNKSVDSDNAIENSNKGKSKSKTKTKGKSKSKKK
ncbi:MAG: hypothetical protein IK100_07345 [Muribaculaceae bacterium]|nr:hypothetical protein [Muribaculaceae bacterium]